MKQSMQRNGLILAAFALVTTGLIALTHTLTSPVIQDQEQRQLQQTLNSIIPPQLHDNDLEHDCTIVTDAEYLGNILPKRVYRARMDGQPVALAMETMTPNGYSGDIRLLVGVNSDGVITGVRVLQHQETPGLGDKIELRIDDWILSFNGRRLTEENRASWAVKKDGGQFDQFTGATITPRAVVGAVRQALAFIQQRQDELFGAPNECQAGTGDQDE